MKIKACLLTLLAALSVLSGLNAQLALGNANDFSINGIGFTWGIYADHRVAENVYQPLDFSAQSHSSPDSAWIVWTSDKVDITLSFTPVPNLGGEAYLAKARASFKSETYLHELYLSMDSSLTPINADLKGAAAIQNGDASQNQTIQPFRDMAAEYRVGSQRFWIVASNYAGCENVEGLAANLISLYDYKGHFFRVFNPATNQTDLLRDTLYRPAGSSFQWGFLIFADKPAVPDINRWPHGKKAALCISNDADGETLPRLQAVYEGSSDHNSPKYYTKGFFARNIPVSNTVFGVYQPILGAMWQKIMEHGNRIGYHTFSPEADPAGTNAQALLTDLLPFNIRMWIDHALLQNPEDLGRYGLCPDSTAYVGDVINASNIDYAWAADTHPNNPFNAFDEAWRLPHRVWEAKAFTRPIWFFGRTRMEVWSYNNGWSMLGMKYLMTPENLDMLIAQRGLHHCYTHFCPSPNAVVGAFYEVTPEGAYEINDEVDDMLQMLDYYRTCKGLWIAPAEDVFDRMLAIEQVRVVEAEPESKDASRTVVLQNCSEMDIADFNIFYNGRSYSIPNFAAGSRQTFKLLETAGGENAPALPDIIVSHANGTLNIKYRDGAFMPALSISIYNIRGQLVQSYHSQPGQQVLLPFQGKASGIYLAKIGDLSGQRQLSKFTVLR